MPLPNNSLNTPFPITDEQIQQYRRDGQSLVRGLATANEIAQYRPTIQRTLREVSEKKEVQGRIEDYSSLFVQVTNIWKLNDQVRRFVIARRFASVAATLCTAPRRVW